VVAGVVCLLLEVAARAVHPKKWNKYVHAHVRNMEDRERSRSVPIYGQLRGALPPMNRLILC